MTHSEGTELVFKDFVVSLINEKGLTDINEEIKDELVSDLLNRLESMIHARILAALPEEDLKDFERMLNENASVKRTQAFLEDKIPDYTNFIADVLLDFRRTYLG